MRRKNRKGYGTRYGTWKDACHKFLLEEDKTISGVELIQRVLTKAGTPWQSAPNGRQVTQLLKHDNRFEHMGEIETLNREGSKYMRASFRARRVRKDE